MLRIEGTRDVLGVVRVWVNGAVLTPARSQQVWNHSPDGFTWGYGGSGPAQLALALLLEAGLSDVEAARWHQAFKWEFIASIKSSERFRLSIDVGRWLAQKERAS